MGPWDTAGFTVPWKCLVSPMRQPMKPPHAISVKRSGGGRMDPAVRFVIQRRASASALVRAAQCWISCRRGTMQISGRSAIVCKKSTAMIFVLIR